MRSHRGPAIEADRRGLTRIDTQFRPRLPSTPSCPEAGGGGAAGGDRGDGLAVGEEQAPAARLQADAIAGAHGDQHTFKVCCRVVRGFDLDDESAIAALLTWNARCEPPWPEAELRRKILGARQYGREPIGGRLRSIR